LIDLSLYVITDERFLNVFNIFESIEKAILGGATVVQYRAKKKTAKEMYEEALIVREEQDRIGGQEIYMPALTPATLWQQTGRWDEIDVLFKLQ